MTPLDKAKDSLKENGYCLKTHGAKHDKWYNPDLKCTITLKRHDFDDDDLRYIRQEIKQNKQRGPRGR